MIQHSLTLVHWVVRKIGFSSNLNMLDSIKNVHDIKLEFQSGELGADIDKKIVLYITDSIDDYTKKINSGPGRDGLVLTYFQYLAVFVTEYILFRMNDSLSSLVEEINESRDDNDNMPLVSADTFNKLAFWMATGSGKTLIMHINIMQFEKYNMFRGKNILLITPNESMTNQHVEEFQASGISSWIYPKEMPMDKGVCVIDIKKLSFKPGKKGVTVHPEVFGGNNLLFVDEAHKGAGGGDRGYFKLRDYLVRDGGFAVEYSATFGQSLSAGMQNDLVREYARSIHFDYSYGFFHRDGYGKDFCVMNLDTESSVNKNMLMLGNLLSFFQQQVAYSMFPDACNEYNIEKPLMLLLGSSVNPKNKDNTSDIMDMVKFLNMVATDRDSRNRPWTDKAVGKIINGDSGIKAPDKKDLFEGRFSFLSDSYSNDHAEICKKMREHVFGHADKCGIQMRAVKGAKSSDNEIALKSMKSESIFGLVYVGDQRNLMDAGRCNDISVIDDSGQLPIFHGVKNNDSPVNILIGAKKFMEGWSSWRVCAMGLLNLGMKEGPLIIQLFGRGVRLKGKDWSLKRRGKVNNHHGKDKALELLENLNIFSIRAAFLQNFERYIRLETGHDETCSIEIKVDAAHVVDGKLRYPSQPTFDESDEIMMMSGDENTSDVTEDVTSSVTVIGADGASIGSEESNSLCLGDHSMDKHALYARLLTYIDNSGKFKNVMLKFGDIDKLLKKCRVLHDAVDGDSIKRDVRKLQDISYSTICQQINRRYARGRRKWEKKHTVIAEYDFGSGGTSHPDHVNFPKKYTLRLTSQNATVIKDLLKSECSEIWANDMYKKNVLPRVHSPQNIYQPLLKQINDDFISTPPGLNQGEEQFIRCLIDFMKDNPSCMKDSDIAILRNQVNGVGFCLKDGSMFYPDFMIWKIDKGAAEHLVFVDPKGIRNLSTFGEDLHPKMTVWKDLAKMSKTPLFEKETKFSIDSFIISTTSYADIEHGSLSKKTMIGNHVLFLEDFQSSKESRECNFRKLFGIAK